MQTARPSRILVALAQFSRRTGAFGAFGARLAVAALAVLAAFMAAADTGAIADLLNFVKHTDSAKITFKQTVVDPDGREETSSGLLFFTRPDRFRLEYRDPIGITLVHNGKKFWYYDRELNQVTVTESGQSNVASGFLAVMAYKDVERNFTLSAAPAEERGLYWALVVPKDTDKAQFSESRFAFDKEGNLSKMQIRDLLGNVISTEIVSIEKDPPDTGQFVFEVPPGVEVFDDRF